jgi:hypothetical protein
MNVLKCEFGEVDETVFQGVERHREHILYILGIEKSD